MARKPADKPDDQNDQAFGGGALLNRIGRNRAVGSPEETAERRGFTPQETEQVTPVASQDKPAEAQERTQEKAARGQYTVYLRNDIVDQLDERALQIRRKYGKRIDRSTLIDEAIEEWLKNHPEA